MSSPYSNDYIEGYLLGVVDTYLRVELAPIKGTDEIISALKEHIEGSLKYLEVPKHKYGAWQDYIFELRSEYIY